MDMLLQINNLCKSYGPNIILDNANFSINEKQKIGVIGRNGAGKSTLFKIITGEEEKDSGTINIPSYTRIGYLQQYDPFEKDETIIDFLERYTNQEKWKCEKEAGQFDLKRELLEKKIGDLSGGYQMRVKLTAMILFEPNLLLLDEPTNYLDLNTLILLEKFLQSYNGSFLIISHDREFLKNTCKFTLEVDQGDTSLYLGSINEYMDYKEQKISTDIKQNERIDKKQKHMQKFVDRFGSKATLAKSAKSKAKAIDKLEDERIGIKSSLETIKIIIPKINEKKGLILKTNDLKIGYKDKDVANDINLEFEAGKKIAILGDNGEGKSTFLKTISDRLDPKSGDLKWRNNIKIDYYAQDIINNLNTKETVENFLKRNSENINKSEVYKMASNFLFKEDDLTKPISILSGGEKSRLCLAGLLLTNNEVLLLDEPTNHLDFETVEALGSALKECNRTVFFISHDRYFINQISTDIVEIKNKKVIHYKRNYEDYLYFLKLNLSENVNNEEIIEEKPKIKEKKRNLEELKKYNTEKGKIESQDKEYKKEIEKINLEFEKKLTQDRIIKLSIRLKTINSLLSENEENWLKIEEKIEKLKNNNIDN